MRGNYLGLAAIWVVLLIVELFWFNGLIHRVHDQEEVFFIMTVVFVTLIVGAVLLLLSVRASKENR